MTSDGDALFRAICEQPREDTPRLVYADWLEENGQPERAEFIRFQCEFQWDLSHPRFMELAAREERFEPFFPEWMETLPRADGIQWREGMWTRGFIGGVTFSSPKAFADHADAVFAAAPVQFLEVGLATDQTIGVVLRSEYLKRLRQLIFPGQYGVAAVRQMAACPHLAHLGSLCVWGGCTDEAAELLAASPHLGGLTMLSLLNHALTDRGVTALIESEQLRGVNSLIVDNARDFGDETVRRLHERFAIFMSDRSA
jgi:uncharacterized protein (TIGR02996 family)